MPPVMSLPAKMLPFGAIVNWSTGDGVKYNHNGVPVRDQYARFFWARGEGDAVDDGIGDVVTLIGAPYSGAYYYEMGDRSHVTYLQGIPLAALAFLCPTSGIITCKGGIQIIRDMGMNKCRQCTLDKRPEAV